MRRTGDEPDDAYIWIEYAKMENFSVEKYSKLLAEQYDLVEAYIVDDITYGTPRQGMIDGLQTGKAFLCIENTGAKKIIEVFANQANIVTIFALDDPSEKVAIEKNVNYQERLDLAKLRLEDSRSFVNYYLCNSDGLEKDKLKESLTTFLTELKP
jgi:guanylate kinase